MDFKQKKYTNPKSIPWYIQSSIIGLSTLLSETILYPLEITKLKLQANGIWKTKAERSFIQSLKNTISVEGYVGLYRGLGLTLSREFTFLMTRMFVYDKLKKFFAADVEKVGIIRKLLPIISSSFVGILFCNTLDIIRIKRVTISDFPRTSIFQEWKNIVDFKTMNGLVKGMNTNFLRNTLFISTEMAVFLQTKLFLFKKFPKKEDMLAMNLLSSLNAAVCTAIVTCPLDVVRTRYMSQIGEPKDYGTFSKCLLDMIRNHGFKVFYRGFIPYVLKIIPSSLLLFVLSTDLQEKYVKFMSL